jgi:hypothetical protein
VLTYCVLIALAIVLDPYPLQVSVFEDSILDEILPVVPANAFQGVVEMLTNAYHLVLLQDEAVSLAFVETLLIPEEAFVS